jgi:hypothetical protein
MSIMPQPQKRLTLSKVAAQVTSRLFVHAHTGSGHKLGPQSRKLQRPVSCLTVRAIASLFLFFGTSQQHLYLSLPTISLCTTNRVSVSLAFLCVCACSVTTSVLFCVSVHLCSLVYFLLFQLYDFVSFYTQLRLIVFIYWSSPLISLCMMISLCSNQASICYPATKQA